jgi:hypothetical protein
LIHFYKRKRKMTLYHFANCLGLAYTPYYLTYKYSGLAEYGAFWKVGQASLMYILTQLAKMLFLATFFPMSELEEEEGGHKFDFFNDFLRATVDMADLVGIYLVMSRVSGKGSVKVLIAGLGWAFAELVLTRLVFLWVGARGVEFDWRYIQKSFEANISLLHFITIATLVWMWTKRSSTHSGGVTGVLSLVLAVACYKGVILGAASSVMQLGSWATLLQDALVSCCLGLVSLQLYLGVTSQDKY